MLTKKKLKPIRSHTNYRQCHNPLYTWKNDYQRKQAKGHLRMRLHIFAQWWGFSFPTQDMLLLILISLLRLMLQSCSQSCIICYGTCSHRLKWNTITKTIKKTPVAITYVHKLHNLNLSAPSLQGTNPEACGKQKVQ